MIGAFLLGLAFVLGVLVGWSWKPSRANVGGDDGGGRLPAAAAAAPVAKTRPIAAYPGLTSPEISSCSLVGDGEKGGKPEKESCAVIKDDLLQLCRLVEEKDGGPSWIQMMDKSMPTLNYQAWRRDPQSGPPQYRSRTVFEDATPELVRDFFWDDDFRMKSKWDDMLIHSSILEKCPTTGAVVVQWVRKFPFFCSDREYIIGRRIWQSGRSYYCITKGVPCSSVPRNDKPRRVDLFYSSWCIRPVESNRGDGQLTACEVLLFHHEDMGIPWEIAKLGVRQGMWGAVKKIEPGLRAYQKERASSEIPISRCAYLAQINTKVSSDYLVSLESSDIVPSKVEKDISPVEKEKGFGIPKFLVIGGAIALACTIDRGLLSKALLFGAARRFGNARKQ